MLVYLIILICLQNCSARTTKGPIIRINNGNLLGRANNNYYSFESIPYAEPPIGENRFESPKPYLKKWKNIRDATKLHEHCLQHPDPLSRTYEINGVEDCLYLNVYTPKLNGNKLYPVVFFIHGGSFMYASGNLLREKILMKHQKFIYVTFNYRLNIFGFLSTGDNEIAGNFGLKDQRLALKWVKKYIRRFKGDPNNILLAGFSAGSASVEYFSLQPKIEDDVVGAVGFSGSVLNHWALNTNPRENAIKLGELLNCPTYSSNVLKYGLKTKTALDIVDKVKYFRNILGISLGVFAPVIEHFSVKDAMIRRNPRELLMSGISTKIPIILSHTAQEGAMFVASFYNEIPNIIKSGNRRFLVDVPWFCDENCNIEELEEIFDDMAAGSIEKLTKVFTDRIVTDSVIESVKIRGRFNVSRTYCYKYDNPAPFGLANMITQRDDINFGTNHGDDVFLILNLPAREAYQFRPDEQRISDNFVKMLETFVTTGKPIFGNIEIPQVKTDNFKYLHIKADNYQIKSLN